MKFFNNFFFIILFLLLLLIIIFIKTIKKENTFILFGTNWFRGLVIAGLSIFVITTLLIGSITLEQNKKKNLDDIEKHLRGILSAAHSQLEHWVEKRISQMKLIVRNPELVQLTKNLLTVEPRQENLLESGALLEMRYFFKRHPDVFTNIGFFIINSDYLSIGSMRDQNVGSFNLIAKQNPEVLKRAFNGEVLFVPPMESDVRLDYFSKDKNNPPTMFFIAPIKDFDNRIIAVMTLRVDPWQDFSYVLQSYRLGKTTETYALNLQGRLLSEISFDTQLHQAGLLSKNQKSALNIEIRDPGGNLIEGFRSSKKRSEWPLTHMAASVKKLKLSMEKTGRLDGHSRIESDLSGYRDYRGIQVFGVWLWDSDMKIGLTTEIDVNEALSLFFMTRNMIFSILGFTLFLSVGAVLLVMIVGERTRKELVKAKDFLEEKVTERTQELQDREKSTQEAEERIRLLLESAGEGLFGVDTNGRVIFINPSALNMLGYIEEELKHQKIHGIIHHSLPDGSPFPESNCLMSKSFKEGKASTANDEMLWRKDGTGFFVEYTSTPILKENEITGAVVTFRDISDRKKTEEQINKLSKAIEQAPVTVVITDRNGSIEYVNPRFSEITGYTAEEAIGQNPRILKSGNQPSEYYQELWETILSGAIWSGDFENKTKKGNLFWERASIAPVKNKHNKITHFVAIKEDITKRREVEE